MRRPTCECGTCAKCKQREYSRRWRAKYPGKQEAANAAWQAKNRDAVRAAGREAARRKRAEDREAYNAYARARRRANPEHFRELDRQREARDKRRRVDTAMRRRFGIELDEYEQLLAEQGGVCAICGQPETGVFRGTLKRLAIDHCHKTSAIRGLLCSRCNPMVGYAQDDPDILRRAADYLERC